MGGIILEHVDHVVEVNEGVIDGDIIYFARVKSSPGGTSLVAQWLGIRLPMQGTQVQALVREDPTCQGTAKPVRHND